MPLEPGWPSARLPDTRAVVSDQRPRPEADAQENRWSSNVPGPLLQAALASLERLRGLDVDFLSPDLTRWGVAPPLPFGPDERAAITADVASYLVKKHGT